MATVIFDFDGTIADSFAVVVAIVHELTRRTKLVTPEEIVRLRRMNLLEVARAEHIPKWRAPFLLVRGRRLVSRRLDEVKVFGGMAETIKQIHGNAEQLFILSSNSTSNVRKFLQAHNLSQYFSKIYGGAVLFGKARVLRKIVRANRLRPGDCIYIGDEPRDIEASKRVGVRCIAVSWGFNAKSLLEEHHPGAIADTPEELLSLLQAGTIQ